MSIEEGLAKHSPNYDVNVCVEYTQTVGSLNIGDWFTLGEEDTVYCVLGKSARVSDGMQVLCIEPIKLYVDSIYMNTICTKIKKMTVTIKAEA